MQTLKPAIEGAKSGLRTMNAVVISAGLMQKTVKVRVGVQKWNRHIGKNFNRTHKLLVHDPRSSLRLGDIITITPGWRVSKTVHHVVTSIVAPFGEPIEARPPVPTEEERIRERTEKKEGKRARKAEKLQEGISSLVDGEGEGEEGTVKMEGKGMESEEDMGEREEEENNNGVWDALQHRVTEEVKAEKVREEKKSWWR